MQHSNRFLALVDSVKNVIKETDVHTVKQKLDAKENFTLIDVREESEWAKGHLPSAIHLGKGIIERDIEKTVPSEDHTIILYCGGGFRSALAAKALQDMGYKSVISMDGGFKGWQQAGFEVI